MTGGVRQLTSRATVEPLAFRSALGLVGVPAPANKHISLYLLFQDLQVCIILSLTSIVTITMPGTKSEAHHYVSA